ncbi:MAG: hypothetical protein JSV45_09510 [Chromatiales bacterium]|nr:MAG: hypothetical protein JSV45_09510 [Chromatiales bacterium]
MGKAGKLIVGVIVTLIIVVGIALTFLLTNLDTIVERAIETVGSDVAGVPVGVGSVKISLAEGSGQINGLTVGNPKGFPRGNALELKTIALALDTSNLSAELVRIKSVLVDGAQVNAIQTAEGNNLQGILDNLESDAPAETPEEAGGTETKLIIDDFQFLNGGVSVEIPKVGERNGKIPDIRLKGIGAKSNGATASEAAKQVLEPIIRQSISSVASISKEDLEKMGREKLDETLGDGADMATRELGKFLGGGKD